MRYTNTLRQHREARGLTQWSVARTVDIHLNRYGRIEKGISQPSFVEGVRLGEFFGVSAETLFPVPDEADASAA